MLRQGGLRKIDQLDQFPDRYFALRKMTQDEQARNIRHRFEQGYRARRVFLHLSYWNVQGHSHFSTEIYGREDYLAFDLKWPSRASVCIQIFDKR